MTRFADRLARTDAAVDREHGELTRIEPRKPGEFLAGGPDPDRPVYEAIGAVDENPQVGRMKQRMGDSAADSADLQGDIVEVSYRVAILPSRPRWPVKHDRIVRLERPGQPALLVSRADFDGVSRLVCRCAREKVTGP